MTHRTNRSRSTRRGFFHIASKKASGLRHTLVDQRGEWQQRIRAVLYHHGLAHRRELHLLSGEGRAWLEQIELPDAAREQVTVAIALTEALNAQITPLDRQLRLYARRQAGCKALMGHYGIGELTAVADPG
jgi:transposase